MLAASLDWEVPNGKGGVEALGESLYDPDEPTAFDAAVLAQLQTAVHGALDRSRSGKRASLPTGSVSPPGNR